jgi:deltex-like protein
LLSLQDTHPTPGKEYADNCRSAYLPDTEEGRKVLMLLKVAFDRRLLFTVGKSLTRDVDEGIVWTDIHHKTKKKGGQERYRKL